MASPRIASLLPSATEICFALDLSAHVVGVSHECDFPAQARTRPVLTSAEIDAHADSETIDRQVRFRASAGLSLYHVDEARLRELAPDLILTQDTCDVCAVSLETVERTVRERLGAQTRLLALSPSTLEDVLGDIARVGRAAGAEDAAENLLRRLRERLDVLRERVAALERPRVLMLEWLSPPMVAGHWTPELIRCAGGEPVLGHEGSPTRATDWSRIAAARPDVVLIAPCGFRIEQTLRELPALTRNGLAQLEAVQSGRAVILDGNAFFNRPGPRLIESAELAARAIHPGAFAGWPDPDPHDLLRWEPR